MNVVDLLAQNEDLVSPGMSACQGCAAELSLRAALKVFGEKTIVGIPPGCMAGAGGGGWDKRAGLKVPSTMPLLDNVASLMAGIKKGYTYEDDVNVVAFAGDGATGDAGLQCLSAAAERKENIIYICYDNEGYMNTGFQKSGTTPYGASTSTTPVGSVGNGKLNFKKDVPMMMAIQDAAYVATLSLAHMPDFINKLQKAKEVKDGLVYLHILSPCPSGWGTKPEFSIKYARLAVETRNYLLYEYRNGKFTISSPTKNIKEPKPMKEFIAGQKRFKHLKDEDIKVIEAYAQSRWQLLQKLAGQV
ncbi:pyruvate synthase subunit PorB [Paradesulfitobacterium aromaticivorans]